VLDANAAPITWRLVSREMLELAIPADLTVGEHMLFFQDAQRAIIGSLSFNVSSSDNRPIVTAITPDSITVGSSRTVVLQGIRFTDVRNMALRTKQEDISLGYQIITDRVMGVTIPDHISRGIYTVILNDVPQKHVIQVQ